MSDRSRDLATAVAAVRSAARACRAVQERLVRPEALEKGDKSPVTVADFASQAIICAELERALPNDPVVGEEDADTLRDEAVILKAVVERVAEQRGATHAEQVLGWIDRGSADARSPRYWTLDPIDGTKGFLRGEQYAIALALIESGTVVLGVLGCPNLPLDGNGGGVGALFTAVRGEPTRTQDLWNASAPSRTVSVAKLRRASEARFCESVESGHSDQDESARTRNCTRLLYAQMIKPRTTRTTIPRIRAILPPSIQVGSFRRDSTTAPTQAQISEHWGHN